MNINTQILISNLHLRHAIYAAHKGECFYTGRNIDFDDMEIDHIVPPSHGGKNCMANYVPTTSSINLKKQNKINTTLVERMIYINTILFAPLTLRYYLKFMPIDEGYTQLRPYLKEYYPELINNTHILHCIAKTNLSFLHKQINAKSSRKAFLYKKNELNLFLLQCKQIIDNNKNISQKILNQELNCVSGTDSQPKQKHGEASVSNQSL